LAKIALVSSVSFVMLIASENLSHTVAVLMLRYGITLQLDDQRISLPTRRGARHAVIGY